MGGINNESLQIIREATDCWVPLNEMREKVPAVSRLVDVVARMEKILESCYEEEGGEWIAFYIFGSPSEDPVGPDSPVRCHRGHESPLRMFKCPKCEES